MKAFTAILYFLCTVVLLGLIGGWIANIFKLAGLMFQHGDITVLLIARAVGVVVPFLGAVLGWF